MSPNEEEADYVTCRQIHAPGVLEFRWTNPGGEIVGHRNERLIADLRAALHYRAACPEVQVPAPWKLRSLSLPLPKVKVPALRLVRGA